MDTRFWGPSGWRMLHLVSFAAPQLPKTHLVRFFKNLPFVLPCKFCRASLTDYYASDPIPDDPRDYAHWLYRIHNRVNAKLRDQKLLETPDPLWEDVEKLYTAWLSAPCSSRRMIGWDFLFSVAYTTPCSAVHTSPMPGVPPLHALHTPELRNRWGVISREERVPYIRDWWLSLPFILPFREWRDVWKKHVSNVPNVYRGRRSIVAWLYNAEKTVCKHLQEKTPHNSFTGLCNELHTFESGCGKTRNLRTKTCRAIQSNARKTLKQRRSIQYKAVGGFL